MLWITWLVENTDYNNIGLVLGVFGTVFSIYTYKVGKERRVLLFKKSEIDIIGGSQSALSDRIEIRFDGNAIPRVTKTTFWIWNEGNRTIDGAAVAKSDPLRIEIPENSTLLESTILASDDANDVSMIQATSNATVIGFEFLEPKQGFKVTLIHTAKTNEAALLGTLKGMQPARDYQKKSRIQLVTGIIGALFLFVMAFIAAICVGALAAYAAPKEYEFVRLILFLGGTLTILIAFMVSVDWHLKREDVKRVPLYAPGD